MGPAGATVIEVAAGETGLPGPSFVKGHYMQVLTKRALLSQERRILSGTRMREAGWYCSRPQPLLRGPMRETCL